MQYKCRFAKQNGICHSNLFFPYKQPKYFGFPHKTVLYWFYMIITFHGGQTVKFQTGDTVIVANPSLAPAGTKQQKCTAATIICSSFSTDHHMLDMVSGSGGEDAFVVDGPGNFEYRGTTVTGEPLGKPDSGDAGVATVYRFTMDDISVCVVGSVLSKDLLNPDASDLFAEPDILIVPLSGETIDIAEAFITFVGPKMIIPVGYWSADDAHIMRFCKEMGFKDAPVDKITLKPRDIASMSKQITLLTV
jgi:hypothetical protein